MIASYGSWPSLEAAVQPPRYPGGGMVMRNRILVSIAFYRSNNEPDKSWCSSKAIGASILVRETVAKKESPRDNQGVEPTASVLWRRRIFQITMEKNWGGLRHTPCPLCAIKRFKDRM